MVYSRVHAREGSITLCCLLTRGATLGSSVRSESADERFSPAEIAGKQVIAGVAQSRMRSGVATPRFPALTCGGSSYRPILPTREGEL